MILIGSKIQIPDWSQALRMEPADYYDEAIVGYDPIDDRFIYNEDKVIDILITKEEMSTEDAVEWYDYNIQGTQGENYPIYIIPAR
jgi:hypothetical protein